MSGAPRPLGPADLPAARAITAGLRWPHRIEDWTLLLALGHGIAIEEEGRLVGTGMWWPHGPDHATIGMVLVSPDRQGRGLGRRIMQALLDAASSRALMLNATAAGLPLYAALGFAPAGEVRQFQGIWAGATVPCDGARPATGADLDTLLRRDAAAFGAPRPACLAALLEEGTVLMDGEGYAVARRFGRGTVIGPVVAPDEARAIALVEALARPGDFVRLDIPATATTLAAALAGQGLAPVDTVMAMTRGPWAAAPSPRRFALAAQALG